MTSKDKLVRVGESDQNKLRIASLKEKTSMKKVLSNLINKTYGEIKWP